MALHRVTAQHMIQRARQHFSGLSAYQRGFLLVMLSTFLFSLKSIFIKLIYVYQVDPVSLMFMRMLMSLPFYLWMIARDIQKNRFAALDTKPWAMAGIFGLFGYYIASLLDLSGLQYIPASLERLILYTYPSFVLLISVMFLGKRLNTALISCLLIIYGGLFVVFLRDLFNPQENAQQLVGAALIFGSAIAFAIYFAGSEAAMRHMSSRQFTCIAMLCASTAIILHFSATKPLASVLHLPTAVYVYCFVVAIVCTVLPSLYLAAGIHHIGAATSSVIAAIGPVMTLVTAYIFLDERISALQSVGFAMVVWGAWRLSKANKAAQTD